MVLAQNSITLARVNDGAKGEGLEVVVGTQTAATGSWTGVANFASLKDGQQITYWLPYAGSGNATLNLTLSGGGTTGAIPCYYGGTTRLTTHYPAGSAIRLLYRENVKVGSTTIAKGWWADANYNGDTYDRIRLNNAITAKSAISSSRLIVGDDSGFFHLAANTSFDITKPILFASSAISSGATGSNNYLSYPTVTLRNNLSGITLTKGKTCYLIGTLNGNIFTPSETMFTATIPTTEDGLTYISLGLLISTYQIYLYPEHPLHQYKDGAFKSAAQVAVDAKDAVDNLEAAVEGKIDSVRETITQQSTSLVNTAESIILEALKNYTETSNFDSFKQSVEAQLKLLSEELSLKFTQTMEDIVKVNDDFQSKFNTISKWFTFDIDGLTIGANDNNVESPFKVVIDNDDFIMYVNGVETLTLDPDGYSRIPDLKVTQRFELMGFLVEQDANGNVNCGIVGG